jgi:hypothetical protein
MWLTADTGGSPSNERLRTVIFPSAGSIAKPDVLAICGTAITRMEGPGRWYNARGARAEELTMFDERNVTIPGSRGGGWSRAPGSGLAIARRPIDLDGLFGELSRRTRTNFSPLHTGAAPESYVW